MKKEYINVKKPFFIMYIISVSVITLGLVLFVLSFCILSPVFGEKMDIKVAHVQKISDLEHGETIEVEFVLKGEKGFQFKNLSVDAYIVYETDGVGPEESDSQLVIFNLEDYTDYCRITEQFNVSKPVKSVEVHGPMIDYITPFYVFDGPKVKFIGYKKYIVPASVVFGVSVVLIAASIVFLCQARKKLKKSEQINKTYDDKNYRSQAE